MGVGLPLTKITIKDLTPQDDSQYYNSMFNPKIIIEILEILAWLAVHVFQVWLNF